MKIEEITREYREEHHLSQRQFSELCGLSPSYIWFLEQGKNPQTGKRVQPSLPALGKIARAMGLTLEELMARCDNMLVALNDSEDDAAVFIALLARLTPAQKEALLALMRSMVS